MPNFTIAAEAVSLSWPISPVGIVAVFGPFEYFTIMLVPFSTEPDGETDSTVSFASFESTPSGLTCRPIWDSSFVTSSRLRPTNSAGFTVTLFCFCVSGLFVAGLLEGSCSDGDAEALTDGLPLGSFLGEPCSAVAAHRARATTSRITTPITTHLTMPERFCSGSSSSSTCCTGCAPVPATGGMGAVVGFGENRPPEPNRGAAAAVIAPVAPVAALCCT